MQFEILFHLLQGILCIFSYPIPLFPLQASNPGNARKAPWSKCPTGKRGKRKTPGRPRLLLRSFGQVDALGFFA
ncbi:MAG: hypothetical protein LBT16_06090, partial [Treponema sp.]|nr:hypothetical protein [Treponema sp.]